MEIRFENKVAFITGAAGGIGYAAARMFATNTCLYYRFFFYSIQTGYEYNDYSTCLCRVWCCWIY